MLPKYRSTKVLHLRFLQYTDDYMELQLSIAALKHSIYKTIHLHMYIAFLFRTLGMLERILVFNFKANSVYRFTMLVTDSASYPMQIDFFLFDEKQLLQC